MTREMELKVLRRNTAAYIAANPTYITFNRETRVTDGAGGWIPSDPAVTGTIAVAFEAVGDRQLPVRRTVDGIEIQPEYRILAEYNADIKRGDWFFIDGVKYEVVFVHPDRGGELTAEVVYRG